MDQKQLEIFTALQHVQKKRLKVRAESKHFRKTIYKWIPTSMISDHIGKSNDTIRYHLYKLQEAGVVLSKKISNNCVWSCITIPGYKESSHNDYVLPT